MKVGVDIPVLTVEEHATVPIGDHGEAVLDPEEAELLCRLNTTRRGFCDRGYASIKFSQYCGIVRLPSRILEVLPKVDSSNHHQPGRSVLLEMLATTGRLKLAHVGDAGQDLSSAPLIDIFVSHFLSLVLDQVRRGLVTRYREEQDDLPRLCGRLDFQRQIRTAGLRVASMPCIYDELGPDNAYNRVVRHTLQTIRPMLRRNESRRNWNEVWPFFEGLGEEGFTSAQVDALPKGRDTRRYAEVLSWCSLLLSLQTPSLRGGTQHSPAILFDMNKLFESWVTVHVGEANREHWDVEAQSSGTSLAMTGNTWLFALRPDVVVRLKESAAVGCIMDAKWKRLDPSKTDLGISEKDAYQMLAYGTRFGCANLRLIYPEVEGAKSNPVRFNIPFVGDAKTVAVEAWMIPLGRAGQGHLALRMPEVN